VIVPMAALVTDVAYGPDAIGPSEVALATTSAERIHRLLLRERPWQERLRRAADPRAVATGEWAVPGLVRRRA
jgi:hypothetical protein